MAANGAATAAHVGAPGGAPASTIPQGYGEVKTRKKADVPALGTVAKSVDAGADEARRKGRRRHKNALLDAAAAMLSCERVAHCQRTPAGSAVAVVLKGKAAAFFGLQQCGSVWFCPICSPRISAERRDELNRLLKWARRQGLIPILMTLTARHTRDDALAALTERVKGAKKGLHQSRIWRSLPIAGHVTATELPCGRNGWHLHFHVLVLLVAPSEAVALAMMEPCRHAWLSALSHHGLECNAHGFDLRGAAEAGDYVAKWGAAEELALSGEKLADVTEADKGRTPWQLLAISAGLIEDSIFSKGQARAKWLEYAHVFKGRRQLVWSRGLKAKAGITERTDEDIAAAAEEAALHEPSQEIGRLNRDEWRTLVRKGLRVPLLEAVEADGVLGFSRILAQIRR